MSINLTEVIDVFQKHESLTDKIMVRLNEIWICARKDNNLDEFEGSPEEFEISENYETIRVQWYDTWPRGGWDRGHITLPLNLLWDDYKPHFQEIRRVRDENIKKQTDKEKKDSEKTEKELLKTLKEKYEK